MRQSFIKGSGASSPRCGHGEASGSCRRLPRVRASKTTGTFGSRQEEAQRLGRVLRPKGAGNPAHFYSIVTRDTVDQDFGVHRQLFLTEQGYRYEIWDETDLIVPPPARPRSPGRERARSE